VKSLYKKPLVNAHNVLYNLYVTHIIITNRNAKIICRCKNVNDLDYDKYKYNEWEAYLISYYYYNFSYVYYTNMYIIILCGLENPFL